MNSRAKLAKPEVLGKKALESGGDGWWANFKVCSSHELQLTQRFLFTNLANSEFRQCVERLPPSDEQIMTDALADRSNEPASAGKASMDSIGF